MLKGKCALLTGSVGGIGYSMAAKLASQGCNIVLHGLEGEEAAKPKRDELERTCDVKTLYSSADVTKPEQIQGLVEEVERRLGGVDILVNNAVVRHWSPVEDFPNERWENALSVNLSAAFYTAKYTIKRMKDKGYGRILNIGSTASMRAMPYRIDYATTKHALIGMTKVIALENLNTGVTCNCLCPHSVLTPSSNARIERLMDDKELSREDAVRQFLTRRQPAGRFVDPDKLGSIVVFLCSDAASDITGTSIVADIGFMAGFDQDA